MMIKHSVHDERLCRSAIQKIISKKSIQYDLIVKKIQKVEMQYGASISADKLVLPSIYKIR